MKGTRSVVGFIQATEKSFTAKERGNVRILKAGRGRCSNELLIT
jgi:hypothetical protein